MIEPNSTRDDSRIDSTEDRIDGNSFQAPDEVDAQADPDPLNFGNPNTPT